MGTAALDLDSLYLARRGVVEVVEVPDLALLVVDGTGRPEGPEFTHAVAHGVTSPGPGEP